MIEPTSLWLSPWTHYVKCMAGGVLSCGLTHTAIVPLDIIKCRMQMYPSTYKGLLSGLQLLIQNEGWKALKTGWVPTLIGYSAQGCFKFGLYELFKDLYCNLLGSEWANKYKNSIWLSASASAETFADIALCPFEMVKVYMQTNQNLKPTSMTQAMSMMFNQRNKTRFPFGGLKPLWSRQIPYTMAKFACFENIVQFIYKHIMNKKPRDEYDKLTQLQVTFVSGYLAGVICAVISQPADNLVTQIANPENVGKSIMNIAQEIGFASLLTKGLSTRILMIGTLTGLQWWIFDAFKSYLGLGTSGGSVSSSTSIPTKNKSA